VCVRAQERAHEKPSFDGGEEIYNNNKIYDIILFYT